MPQQQTWYHSLAARLKTVDIKLTEQRKDPEKAKQFFSEDSDEAPD